MIKQRKLKWTKAYRRATGREMIVDSTLQIGARRNVPVRYNRDLVTKALAACERVAEIRARRERAFYKRRMAGNRARELAAARKLVSENEHLLPRLRGSEKRKLADMAAENGVDIEELEKEVLAARKEKSKSKVVGRQVVRQKLRVDGSVEEIVDTQLLSQAADRDDFNEEDDDEEDGEDDDEMDMD
jgi:large subunit ribosomal protein L24e